MPNQDSIRSGRTRGFTLIELLIVIAIILILIAIALPNFLEAQLRARVTKAKAEMRSLHIALDSYYLDWNYYPAEHERDERNRLQTGLNWITSPHAYIKFLPQDPFAMFGEDQSRGFMHISYETGGLESGDSVLAGGCGSCLVAWVMFSNGPDARQEIWGGNPHYDIDTIVDNYSPTNGTKSRGGLYRWGGDPYWIGIQTSRASNQARETSPRRGRTIDGQIYFHRFPPF